LLAVARSLWKDGKLAQGDDVAGLAAEHARRAGDSGMVARIVGNLIYSAVVGRAPTSTALQRCDAYAPDLERTKVGRARLAEARGLLHARRGDVEVGRALLAEAREIYFDLAMEADAAALSQSSADVELLAGDCLAAERQLRTGFEALDSLGERHWLPSIAARLAKVLHALGDDVEAERFTSIAELGAVEDDVVALADARGARANVLMGQGNWTDAERVAMEALHLMADTDLLEDHAAALIDLGTVWRGAGRAAEAAEVVQRALHLYEEKENLVAAGWARDLLCQQTP
jgi:tetratricopeptide (TPR) repeat protein